MSTLVTVIHVISCVLVVLLVMLQSGKGAEVSASFGGSSQTVFGSSGGTNFFVKFTQGCAAVFFTTSILLTVLGSNRNKSVFEGHVTTPPAGQAPAAPVGDAPKDAAPAQNASPAADPAKK